jgi:hypothetical protein
VGSDFEPARPRLAQGVHDGGSIVRQKIKTNEELKTIDSENGIFYPAGHLWTGLDIARLNLVEQRNTV